MSDGRVRLTLIQTLKGENALWNRKRVRNDLDIGGRCSAIEADDPVFGSYKEMGYSTVNFLCAAVV